MGKVTRIFHIFLHLKNCCKFEKDFTNFFFLFTGIHLFRAGADLTFSLKHNKITYLPRYTQDSLPLHLKGASAPETANPFSYIKNSTEKFT